MLHGEHHVEEIASPLPPKVTKKLRERPEREINVPEVPVHTVPAPVSESFEERPDLRARVAGGHKVWDKESGNRLNMELYRGRFPWRDGMPGRSDPSRGPACRPRARRARSARPNSARSPRSCEACDAP